MPTATHLLALGLALGLAAAGVSQTSRTAAKPGAKTKQTAGSAPQGAGKAPSVKGAASSASKAAKPSAKAAPKSSAKAPAKSLAKRTARRRTPLRPAIQQQPTPERYREIQQALIDRGFLEGEPTGKWDEATVAAMKRFQAEQQLQPTGKIDALSLIRLGLGPKRQAAGTNGVIAGSSQVQVQP